MGFKFQTVQAVVVDIRQQLKSLLSFSAFQLLFSTGLTGISPTHMQFRGHPRIERNYIKKWNSILCGSLLSGFSSLKAHLPWQPWTPLSDTSSKYDCGWLSPWILVPLVDWKCPQGRTCINVDLNQSISFFEGTNSQHYLPSFSQPLMPSNSFLKEYFVQSL